MHGNHRRKSSVSVLALSTLIFFGCASNPTGKALDVAPSLPQPLSVAERDLDTLLYLGVELPIVGSTLGAHHDGLLKVPQYTITGTSKLQRTWSSWMNEAGSSMLQDAGYKVRKPSKIFGGVESYADVRYALAGQTTSLSLDTYSPLAGDKTEVQLSVTWELFDAESEAVLYERTTTASAVTGGSSGDGVILAFRRLFLKLLGDPTLVAAFPDARDVPEVGVAASAPDGEWRLEVPRPGELIRVETDDLNPSTTSSAVEGAVESVISLHSKERHGSGFIITRNGLGLTNYHVVADAGPLHAVNHANDSLPARVLRVDTEADVALIEVQCPMPCRTAPVATTEPHLGENLFIIGMPLSDQLSYTVTKGILSATRLQKGVTVVQTDAPVNPGNSGGPILAEEQGGVVGIVNSKYVGEEVEGIGFGISVLDALRRLGVRLPGMGG